MAVFVEMKNISKTYGRVAANRNVDFSLEKGEIHSLLGENGAGKTTLMKILYGMTRPDTGEIFLGGKALRLRGPKDAVEHGISMVHQHFMLVNTLTVTENIVLGSEPRRGPFFDYERAVATITELSERFSLGVDPRAKIADIPIGQKQRVEIIKALYRGSDLIILDEPTAVLTSLEVAELFHVLRELKAAGKTIVIITHKLREVMEISDRVTILNGGKKITTRPTASVDAEQLAELMVGRKVAYTQNKNEPIPESTPVLLEVRGAVATRRKVPRLRGLDLFVRSGEILGICGVEGNGQTELIEAVTGILRLKQGEIRINGEPVPDPTPRAMLALGVGHIPEDRSTRGLVSSFSIRDNIVLGYHRRPSSCKRGVLQWPAITRHAEQVVAGYDIRTDNPLAPVSSLSGGNQQKAVIGRVLSQNPDIIVAAQPTRGVDIGAIEYIHQKLIEMKQSGKAILLISAEIDELLRLSDYIGVLYEGRIVAHGKTQEFDERRLGRLMTGLGEEDGNGTAETAAGE